MWEQIWRFLFQVQAFHFTCPCGEGVVAQVPKTVGALSLVSCACGAYWEMEWMGDRFRTRMVNPNADKHAKNVTDNGRTVPTFTKRLKAWKRK